MCKGAYGGKAQRERGDTKQGPHRGFEPFPSQEKSRLQRAGEGARARGEEANKSRDISANPEGSGAQCVAVTNRLTAVRRMRRLFAEDLGETGNHRRLPANSFLSNYFQREPRDHENDRRIAVPVCGHWGARPPYRFIE